MLADEARAESESKWQTKSPLQDGASQPQTKIERGKETDVEAQVIDPPICCHFDLCSGDVSRLNSTTRSNNEGMSTCRDHAITGRSSYTSSIHPVGTGHDSGSPDVRANPPELHKSVFTTLSEGPRSPPPPYTPFSVFARTQNDLHSLRTDYRPQAVPIDLPNDPVSRERREAALRDRGLLPPRQPQDLSASGADTDRRIDVPRKNDGLSSGADNGRSDAIEIAQSWRIRNSKWLSDTLPKSNGPGNSTTEDTSPRLSSYPIYLLSTPSNTFLPSPTSPSCPTPPQSVCHSSDTEDSSETTDNGEHIDLSVSPAFKDSKGPLCQETAVERSEPLSDDDDIDTFHRPLSPSLLTAIGGGRMATPRRPPDALLSGLKSRGSTLGSTSPSGPQNSTSMVNLRSTTSGSSFVRTRAHSTVSRATPRPSPPSPPNLKTYDPLELRVAVKGVTNNEARRLCEIAFLT